jgi:3-deoxy-D-manno-octulosonic-acid transferase
VDVTLDALRPTAIVFTKTEVWPTLVERATARSIPVALVAGTVPPGSSRAAWPARTLMRRTWARLSLACAVSREDGAALEHLGVPTDAVVVTGDPGIDSAAERAGSADPSAPYLAPFHAVPAPTLVAGSTWAADEAVLIPALGALRRAGRAMRVVVAPHEPTEEHVSGLVAALDGAGWSTTTLSAVESAGTLDGHDAVVVDSVGKLAHLYTIGDVAYVGGGFHDQGLHSVLEPAAAGLPTVFGPRHHNARSAHRLLAVDGAKIASGTQDLQRVLKGWLDDTPGRVAAGGRARDYIGDHRGAARNTAETLISLIG